MELPCGSSASEHCCICGFICPGCSGKSSAQFWLTVAITVLSWQLVGIQFLAYMFAVYMWEWCHIVANYTLRMVVIVVNGNGLFVAHLLCLLVLALNYPSCLGQVHIGYNTCSQASLADRCVSVTFCRLSFCFQSCDHLAVMAWKLKLARLCFVTVEFLS